MPGSSVIEKLKILLPKLCENLKEPKPELLIQPTELYWLKADPSRRAASSNTVS